MDLAKKISQFERDFIQVKESFPKLVYGWIKKDKLWVISGELDICDVKGDYWNTFNIGILVSETYPYCVPVVFERSEITPRDIDWHISKEGICCVDSDNKLLAMSRLGINIKDFIAEKVYTYFANQLFKLEEKVYAGAEYKHHIDGVIQYYLEDLRIPTVENILVFLEMILNKADLTRNRMCPCSSGEKIKNCHEKEIETIKSLGREKITSNLKKIRDNLIAHNLE
ncbi:hypothetical protein [Flavobacterium terrisoli]|uniref:hypothetical protein n=1 Tax=Flavobacterium terrisoli TaxID=3242195 RepID=UPI00254284EE|nr:hypothetical protein [Flavobacterium buctense]